MQVQNRSLVRNAKESVGTAPNKGCVVLMAGVLLVNPTKKVPLLDWALRYPPLGLMSIASVLEGHEVEILDMKAEKKPWEELARKQGGVDIVGVTALTPSVDSALKICRDAKRRGAMTVMGGVHPSLAPEVVLNPEVDVAVRGEGEVPFRAIADGAPLTTIPGISYVGRRGVAHNPQAPPVDLDALPPPRRDLVSKYRGGYSAFGRRLDALSTARGCPYRCSFCCVPVVWKGYREASPASVIEEIKRMEGADVVAIVDDNFCHNMRRVEEICDRIILEGLDQRLYSVFSRVDSIVKHPETVAKMARANMRVVLIGIEGATQAALDDMNKMTRIEEIKKACGLLDRNGILIWAGHIIGNLGDSYDDVEALIQMSMELPVDIAQYTVITPYPGTALFQAASKEGFIDDYDFAEYCECDPPMHTASLSRMEIMELQLKAYLKFYGVRAMLSRAARWYRNPAKRWILDKNFTGIRSFWWFRTRSALYFLRTYRELVAETEGITIHKHSPLISTPAVYSLSSGVVAALITLLLTMYLVRFYGEYSSYPKGFIVADLLFAAMFVAFVTAAVATPLAVKSYRNAWIFSLRRRRPALKQRTLAGKSLLNGLAFSAASFCAAVIVTAAIALTAPSARLGYGAKEVLVTSIAFLAACLASYLSIHSARNGGIFKG